MAGWTGPMREEGRAELVSQPGFDLQRAPWKEEEKAGGEHRGKGRVCIR